MACHASSFTYMSSHIDARVFIYRDVVVIEGCHCFNDDDENRGTNRNNMNLVYSVSAILLEVL